MAEAEGRLKSGDEILLINKKSFKGQEAAAELLKVAIYYYITTNNKYNIIIIIINYNVFNG